MATLRRLREVPQHYLSSGMANFRSPSSCHQHLVETHYFNYKVSILIPECAVLPKDLKSLVTELGPYYLVKNLPLHEFITADFINTFVKKGAAESSLLSYFSKYHIQEHQPSVTESRLGELPCPVLQSDEMTGQPGVLCGALELFEWLGAVCSNVGQNNEPHSFISTYCCPQPNTPLAKAYLCSITGFLLPEKICLLLERLRHYFDEPKLTPWLTLSVHGFADSPVSWKEKEHGFHKGGEHIYNFVIFNNQDYWLQMAIGVNSDCPP